MSLYQGIGSDIKGGLVARSNAILREQADQRGGMIGGKEGTAGYWKKGSGGGGSNFLDPRVQYERPYWQGLPDKSDGIFDAGESVYRKPVWRVDTSGGSARIITNKRRVTGKGMELPLTGIQKETDTNKKRYGRPDPEKYPNWKPEQ